MSIGGPNCGSDWAVGEPSVWDSDVVEDAAELAPNGSPKLSNSDEKLPVPFLVVGEIGDSGKGACVGERGVASVPGSGVGAFVETGVLISVEGFDTSPIPKDREARSLSSNRERGLLGSCTPPLAVPGVPARAGLDGCCVCSDLRIFESAESAS